MEEPGVRMTEVPELGKAPEALATIRDHHLDPRDLFLRARGHRELIKPLEALRDQTPLELTHRVVDLPALEGMPTFGTNQINQIMDQVSVLPSLKMIGVAMAPPVVVPIGATLWVEAGQCREMPI